MNHGPSMGYPRPQLVRDSFLSLDGRWEFALTSGGDFPPEPYPDTIQVPYCPESSASGLKMPILPRQTMHYRRRFSLPDGFVKDRVLLHFGAVDQTCTAYVNGTPVGTHEGGYLPFVFDITSALHCTENLLTVTCTDPLDHDLPWGKQTYLRGGMWYTPVSGIWQSVWIESVSHDAIHALHITPSDDALIMTLDTTATHVTLSISALDLTEEFTLTEDKTVHVPIQNGHLWSPEDPFLYAFTLRTEGDFVSSYFGLRRIEIKPAPDGYLRVHLNGKPLFLHGVLDQGYFEEGIYTPPSPASYAEDILKMKRLGFNLLRKHIKTEPEVFYCLCDKYGMLVMQDFINTGNYSFLRDTALPTVGIRSMPGIFAPRRKRAKAFFLQTACGIQDALKSHPSVIAYTVFNEGWGQFSASDVYSFLKARDPSRLYDATSGWFAAKKSDFDSRHVYFRPLRLRAGKKALLLSEFGGYSFRVKGHTFSEKNYGYRTYDSADAFASALLSLYREQVIPAMEKGLCGAIYTQLSDVEEETNGLLTYDRAVQKIAVAPMREIAKTLGTLSDPTKEDLP